MRVLSTSLLLAWAIAVGRGGSCDGGESGGAGPPKDVGHDGAPSVHRRGAAPGNEHGPGAFVPRKEKKTFYAGSGGQLWYYLNLYYWAPEGADPKDLWIQAVVVERFEDLTRWPDATPVSSPPPKTTVEYWEVGPTGRTVRIDNHKDFWLESENFCSGAVDVTMTLCLGRVEVRGADGQWSKPATHYVLDRKSYEPKSGVGEDNIRFEPLADEPVDEWGYVIPWSECPGRFVKSNWEGMKTPDLALRSSVPVAPPKRRTPVTTDSK